MGWRHNSLVEPLEALVLLSLEVRRRGKRMRSSNLVPSSPTILPLSSIGKGDHNIPGFVGRGPHIAVVLELLHGGSSSGRNLENLRYKLFSMGNRPGQGVWLTGANVPEGEPGAILPQAEKLLNAVDGRPHLWLLGVRDDSLGILGRTRWTANTVTTPGGEIGNVDLKIDVEDTKDDNEVRPQGTEPLGKGH